MQRTHLRHKFYLYRAKVIVVIALLMISVSVSYGQKTRWVKKNNPNYDERKLTYGFMIGLHSSMYQVKYSDKFLNLNSLHSVTPDWSGGVSLGFIVNYKLAEFFDLRLTPKVGFYENRLQYRYIDKPTDELLIETTMVEFPLLLKYKSERRGNVRMYMIGGVNPSLEASGRKNLEEGDETLEVLDSNISLEAGFGFDLYYPLFKFSPELRFSRGIVNILNNTTNTYGEPLQRVNTNTITLYFIFQ